MGEARREALRVGFVRSIKLEFHGAKVSSDGGLVTYREPDSSSSVHEIVISHHGLLRRTTHGAGTPAVPAALYG